MAVQQNRKTPSKRDMRRSHDALEAKALSIDPTSGETHRRHHVMRGHAQRLPQVKNAVHGILVPATLHVYGRWCLLISARTRCSTSARGALIVQPEAARCPPPPSAVAMAATLT